MKTSRTVIIPAILTILFLSGVASGSIPPQYSAKQVTTISNGTQTHTTRSRIYVGDRKIREEIMGGQGVVSIMIVRMDKNVVYQINPANQSALELPFKVSPSQQMMMNDSKNRFVKIGTGTVDGIFCDKYEMRDKGKVVGYTWNSRKTGYPVMIRSADGRVVTRLSDFTPGPQADSLFEVPSGYHTMNMQGIGKTLGHAFGSMLPSLP